MARGDDHNNRFERELGWRIDMYRHYYSALLTGIAYFGAVNGLFLKFYVDAWGPAPPPASAPAPTSATAPGPTAAPMSAPTPAPTSAPAPVLDRKKAFIFASLVFDAISLFGMAFVVICEPTMYRRLKRLAGKTQTAPFKTDSHLIVAILAMLSIAAAMVAWATPLSGGFAWSTGFLALGVFAVAMSICWDRRANRGRCLRKLRKLLHRLRRRNQRKQTVGNPSDSPVAVAAQLAVGESHTGCPSRPAI